MPTYMVERYLPGVTSRRLREIQQAAYEASERLAADGYGVHHLRSVYLPGEARCLCFFTAPTSQLVREVNQIAELPYSRIINALELTSGGGDRVSGVEYPATEHTDVPS